MQDNQLLAKTQDSFILKGLSKIWPLLTQHEMRQIGDGSSTSIWSHRWLPCGVRIQDLVEDVLDQLADWKVVNLIANGDWNWPPVNSIFPTHIGHQLYPVLPPAIDNGPDVPVDIK